MSLAIECHNLVKRYDGKPPVEAVRGLELAVPTGQCFGLLGPNGAGKTTTIEILEGLLTPTSGDVCVLGRRWENPREATELRHRLGITLQETRLPDKLTVLETLRLFASFYPRHVGAEIAMDRVGLREKAHALANKLSGGQRQRLAVACGLVGDPELFFLDEPTTGLDPQSRRQLWDIIVGFRERGRTVLLTTHYMDEAERLCDTIAIVDHGRVIALGSPRQLIAQLGAENIVEFSLLDRQLEPVTDLNDATTYFAGLPSVNSLTVEGMTVRLTAAAPHQVIPAVLERLNPRGWSLASLTNRHASLEDVFVALTGRTLRDDGANA